MEMDNKQTWSIKIIQAQLVFLNRLPRTDHSKKPSYTAHDFTLPPTTQGTCQCLVFVHEEPRGFSILISFTYTNT